MKIQNRNSIFLALVIAFMFLTPTTFVLAGTNTVNTNADEMLEFDYISNNELEITFNLKDLEQNEIYIENELFTNFQIKNSGFLGALGRPQLPIISKLIAVPTNEVTIDVINSEFKTIEVGKLYPAQTPQTDDSEINDFVIDESFYMQDSFYPGKIAEIVDNGDIRDISFIKLELYPINYNPKQGLATIYNEISIRLSWDNEVLEVESDFQNAQFFNFYKNTFSNWNKFLDNTQLIERTQNRDPGADFIMITHDDFYEDAKDLADWKHKKGYMTDFVNLSDIGTSANDIKQYIQNAYDSWNPQPSFVCLIGDAEFIPTSASGTDLYYVTTDGSDYYPDMFIGRIPADNAQQANVMIQKILNYEQNPPTLADFYENFAVAAYFQDDEQNGYETRRFVRTSEEVRDYLQSIDYIGERIYVTEPYINPTNYNNGNYGNGEPLPPELLRANGFLWDGDADDILNAVNEGVFILNHRDHGFSTGWGDPYFDTGHIAQLNNGELLPVVFSLNCQTGQFHSTECFCEEFVRKEGGGCVAIFGASRTSYSGYNDWLCRGFYDARWPDFDTEFGDDTELYTLGEMLNYGKVYMANTWGDPWGYEDITFEMFHLFCDPTLEIWTALPEDLDATYTMTSEEITVTVSGPSGLVGGALVGISQESGFYARGVTDSTGKVTLSIIGGDIEEEVTLVASAHDYKPFISTFMLNQIPEIPDKPDGPLTGKPGTEYTFSTSTIDADGDQIYFMWRWGDGDYSDWIGPFDSGDTISTTHTYSKSGNFQIRVKAKDTNDLETDWSETHMIQITKGKSANTPFLRILQSFPNLYNFLKIFLGF